MFGSFISLHALLELYHKSTAGIYNFLAEIVNYSLAKLLLGSQCIVQGIQRLDTYGEKVFSHLGLFIMTKWKPLLVLLTMIFCIFRILQKTRGQVQVQLTNERFCLLRLFKMIKNAHMPGKTADIISLIEKHDININSKHPKSESGLTLFLCACLSGNSGLISYMLKRGGDVNSCTTCKDSALHLASFCCATQNVMDGLGVITSLFEAGCNINSRNWLGNTPLCIAASSGKCDLVRHLLSLGGDKSICNNDGIYAMDFATNAGHLEAANLLAIPVSNPHVWDIVEPHTPPRVKLGLQSPCKRHLVYSSFKRKRMDFCSLVK
ncbi:ankyrin repeat and EF-hand domain-containing protein 1-like [Montipora capricornis]|uniref:ankyrin repeat and EF-hand domain-containing protein 1-like n=1 Tax=Montipora foliosa TaxID=591990 RepID=UPI0035F1A337